MKVLAHADLILLLLHSQHTVHRFGGSPTCSGYLSQCVLITSWIAVPPFSRTFSFTQTVFSSVLFLDGCPKHLPPLTEVMPIFNLDTHLEPFVLPIYLPSKSYFQHLKICMSFPVSLSPPSSNCKWDNTHLFLNKTFLSNYTGYSHILGDRGGTVVKVLYYKSEGRWFVRRWCHWNFPLT